MEKLLLIIIFIAGIPVSIKFWKGAYQQILIYKRVKEQGFIEGNFGIMPCTCGECNPDSPEEQEKILCAKMDAYQENLRSLAGYASEALYQSVFASGITLLALRIYLLLTFNF